MAHEVVHDEGNANQVHESEDVVRDVLRMDWKTYHNLVDEYVLEYAPAEKGIGSERRECESFWTAGEASCSCGRVQDHVTGAALGA